MNTAKSNGRVEMGAEDPVAKELEQIKRLLVLLVKQGGASQKQIAQALHSSQGTVSKQYRFGDVEPFLTRMQDGEEK
jgi:hypothetical protein